MPRRILYSLALAALAVISLAPLLTVAGELLRTGEERRRAAAVFLDPSAWRLFGRTAAVALGAGAVAISAAAALALAGIPRRGRWLAALALGPLATPPTVYGVGWKAVADSFVPAWPVLHSAWLASVGCAAAMGLSYAPLAAAFALAARRWQDASGVEAARLSGVRSWRRLLRIELPHLAGPLGAAFLAIAALALSQFEIPAALNHPSLPLEIYASFQATFSVGAPAALAFLPVLPALALGFYAWRRIQAARPTDRSATRWRALYVPGRAPWVVWGAFVAAAFAAPMVGLFRQGLDRQALRAMAPDVWDGLRDTMLPYMAGMAICLGLGWALADMASRWRRTGAFAVCAAVAPAAVAPAIVGIGIIRFWNQPFFQGAVYGTSAAWVLAWTARFLPFALLAFLAARRLLGREFLETARLAAVPDRIRQTRLLGPALSATIAAAAAGCLALVLGEVGATTLLSAPGIDLLSHRLHSRLHIGPASHVAAFSLMYGALSLALSALLWALGQWVAEGKKGE
ncbi:MAG: hypothetical protein NTW86_18090 [Candidatus Sumerlaeota bacterium]|nr:hypothetical protein [Candidatus Sumerlaeota bacterium]